MPRRRPCERRPASEKQLAALEKVWAARRSATPKQIPRSAWIPVQLAAKRARLSDFIVYWWVKRGQIPIRVVTVLRARLRLNDVRRWCGYPPLSQAHAIEWVPVQEITVKMGLYTYMLHAAIRRGELPVRMVERERQRVRWGDVLDRKARMSQSHIARGHMGAARKEELAQHRLTTRAIPFPTRRLIRHTERKRKPYAMRVIGGKPPRSYKRARPKMAPSSDKPAGAISENRHTTPL